VKEGRRAEKNAKRTADLDRMGRNPQGDAPRQEQRKGILGHPHGLHPQRGKTGKKTNKHFVSTPMRRKIGGGALLQEGEFQEKMYTDRGTRLNSL